MDKAGAELQNGKAVPISLKSSTAYALAVLAGLFSALFPSAYGGVVFLCGAVGIFSYVLIASFRIRYIFIVGAIAYGFAIIFKVKPILAIISLAVIPMSVVMARCVKRGSSLSYAVATVSISAGIFSLAVILILYLSSGDAFIQGVEATLSSYKENMRAQLELFNSNVAEDMRFSEDYINGFISTVTMISPAVVVLLFELVSYICAKILRFITIINSADTLFRFGKWPVTVSLPASVSFFVAYTASVFSEAGSLAYYAAINLALIMMPPQAIVGMAMLFGRRGILRKNNSNSKRRFWLLIVCGYFLIINPFMILIVASFLAVYYNIKFHLTVLFEKIRRKDK